MVLAHLPRYPVLHAPIYFLPFSLNPYYIQINLPPTFRIKVLEHSPLISENSGYETIQIYR